MESFFFGVDLERYCDRLLASGLHRVDVSGGLVYLDAAKLTDASLILHDLDRMVMMIFVRQGTITIEGEELHAHHVEGEIGFYTSRRQNWSVKFEQAEGFVLFVADFFLKRYLHRNREEGVIDQLYAMIEEGGALEQIAVQPLDALSLYLIDRIVHAPVDEPMWALRGEHRVVELMMHRFGMLGLLPEGIDTETLETASRAKAILEAEFSDPPIIDDLARRCATNTTKLKKLFKRTYKTTLYGYVQRLRMEEANLLLRQERLSIGEVARRVGYRHQGHFSRIFYNTYGIYPKTLK
jgi:AraC-like DNA-binding protein